VVSRRAIAVNNEQSNWSTCNQRCWPTVHIVDKRGRVRYGWKGDLSYEAAVDIETVRKLVDVLLLERS
jgi:hypothetical protein